MDDGGPAHVGLACEGLEPEEWATAAVGCLGVDAEDGERGAGRADVDAARLGAGEAEGEVGGVGCEGLAKGGDELLELRGGGLVAGLGFDGDGSGLLEGRSEGGFIAGVDLLVECAGGGRDGLCGGGDRGERGQQDCHGEELGGESHGENFSAGRLRLAMMLDYPRSYLLESLRAD